MVDEPKAVVQRSRGGARYAGLDTRSRDNKFVILSAAKDLLFCHVRKHQVLRSAQDDKSEICAAIPAIYFFSSLVAGFSNILGSTGGLNCTC